MDNKYIHAFPGSKGASVAKLKYKAKALGSSLAFISKRIIPDKGDSGYYGLLGTNGNFVKVEAKCYVYLATQQIGSIWLKYNIYFTRQDIKSAPSGV